ncbi:hypothetical protein ACR0YV_002563 [Enterococcus faecalis]|uniref:hypothetical protein n=1 Tax=Enterococcus TaxID=1350 RepID=UPI000F805502|nr:hypothetical protein [Enterococcus faecalis]EIB6821668.1 hypothetical protein [Enterococcus faecalis]EKZ0058000.1 hypothetical protein [Enterococcus faecalis]MDK4437609.1 hypothetical protein [Enterococcus faecalis]RTK57222.1 hypothetical protein DRJ73_12390 [Enterococcus faecalis]
MSNRPELNLDKKKIKNMEYTFIKEIDSQKGLVFKEDIIFSKSNISIFLFAKDMFIRSITKEDLKNYEIEFLVVLSTIIADCTKNFYNYFFMENSKEYPYEFILDVNRLVGIYYATNTLAHRYKINSASLFLFLQSLKKFIDS